MKQYTECDFEAIVRKDDCENDSILSLYIETPSNSSEKTGVLAIYGGENNNPCYYPDLPIEVLLPKIVQKTVRVTKIEMEILTDESI